MHEIHTTIDINAPAATVRSVLTDFAAYPEWNPRSRIEGEAAEGARLTVAPGPEAEGMPTFRPRVLAAGPRDGEGSGGDGPDGEGSDGDGPDGEGSDEAAYELRWLGHLWVRGLFDGEHSFVVEPLGESRSRLTQSETFRGLLAGLLLRRYGADTEAGFHAVNAALKARAESLAADEPVGVAVPVDEGDAAGAAA